MSLLLNLLFCYGTTETYTAVIKIFQDYLPRFWDPTSSVELSEESNLETSSEKQKNNSAPKSFWKSLSLKSKSNKDIQVKETNKNTLSIAKTTKTKETEAFLESLHKYLKAIVLLCLQKTSLKEGGEPLCELFTLINFVQDTLFAEKYQDNVFLACLLYQLLSILLRFQ